MDEEEHVVGVVKFCDVCDEKTVHVDGVCRDHKIVRRRKQVVAATADEVDEVEEPPPPRPRPAPSAPKKNKRKQQSRVGRIFAFLVLGAVLVGMGMFHVVYGSSGIKLCRKDGFTLAKTLINVDDARNAKPPDVALLKTLAACGVQGPTH